MKKAKKIGLITLAVVGAALVVGGIGAYNMFKEEMQIISSIERVKANLPVYEMNYESDYYFDEFLANGGASSDQELTAILTNYISHGFYKVEATNQGAGCSTISAMDKEGRHLWGRNFDWTDSVVIITKCKPENGYQSIATCEFANITGDSTVVPEDMMNKMLAVAALYVPMDGINEKGLCVADLEVNEGGMINVDTEKPDLTITTAIRLLLNKAATTDEAIELLRQYDIHTSGDISHHLAIADANGKSVVVEFVNGEMVIVESPYVTNFNLANGDISAGGESAKERYEILENLYEQNNGIFTKEQIKEALMQVSKEEGTWETRWSLIYNTSSQSVEYYFERDYEAPLIYENIFEN